MSNTRVDVRMGAAAVSVGELIYSDKGNKRNSVFTYHQSWIDRKQSFALSPDMPLRVEPYYGAEAGNTSALPMPVTDGAPDSWGQKIIRMALKDEAGRGRQLNDFDYLIQSDDHLRSGALRYFDGRGASGKPLAGPRLDAMGKQVSIPRLYAMEDLIAKVRAFEADPEQYQANRAKLIGIEADPLLANIGSLGGARPKVNVLDDDGNVWIAKLAKAADSYSLSATEVLALRLAEKVGLRVAQAKLLATREQRYPVALVKRFDRTPNGARIPFISAQTFMGLEGTEPSNYVDIAQRMQAFCYQPKEQMAELFDRMMFTVLIQNGDDHLRNHGFTLTTGGQWQLSPAYDINPVPSEGVTLSTAISDIHGYEMSIEAVIEVAPYFDISEAEARLKAKAMSDTILTNWRALGTGLGMSSHDFRAIAPAFDNAQLHSAAKLPSPSAPSTYRGPEI